MKQVFFSKMTALLAGLLVITAFWAGCKKDDFESKNADEATLLSSSLTASSFKQAAMLLYGTSAQQGTHDRSYTVGIKDIEPEWDAAFNSKYAGQKDILIVPVKSFPDKPTGSGMNLIFYQNDKNILDYRLLVHIPNKDYYESKSKKISVNDFTGVIFPVTPNNQIGTASIFSSGILVGTDTTIAFKDAGCDPDKQTDCPSWNKSFWGRIKAAFGGSGNGGGGTVPINSIFNSNTIGYGIGGNLGTNGGSGGAGGGGLGDYFDLSLFLGFDLKIAQNINDFKTKYGISYSSEAILSAIIKNCNLSRDDSESLYFEVKHIVSRNIESIPDCMRDVVVQDRLSYFQNEYCLNLSSAELTNLIGESCVYSSNFPICLPKALLSYKSASCHFLSQNINNPNAKKAVLLILKLESLGYLSGTGNDNDANQVIAAAGLPTAYIDIITNYAMYKAVYAGQPNAPSDIELMFKATMDAIGGTVHTLLSICGLVEVVGTVCDLADGTLYLLEGDGYEAGLSYAATIPITGFFVGTARLGHKIIKMVNGGKTELKFIKNATTGLWEYGSNADAIRSQFRRILNTAAGFQAHHILPLEVSSHPVIQAATKMGFHVNDIKNGISLPIELGQGMPKHLGSHGKYTDRIEASLDDIKTELEAASNFHPFFAEQKLNVLLDKIRAAINDPQFANGTINDVTW